MLAFEQRLLAVVHSSGTYNAAVRIVHEVTLKSEKVVQFDHKKMKTTENYISCGTTLYINQVWNAVHILLRLLRGPRCIQWQLFCIVSNERYDHKKH